MDAVLGIFDADQAYAIEFPVRLAAAEALGQAGDPRLRQENWITIKGAMPAGLRPFQIARYPVTVEEYRRFVENEGYQNERWWAARGFGESTEPGNWDEQVQHPNWPVTGVMWYEACVYCTWEGTGASRGARNDARNEEAPAKIGRPVRAVIRISIAAAPRRAAGER
jgi:hypothetical protein